MKNIRIKNMEILQIGSDSDLELHKNKVVYEEASKKVFVL